jgi:1-phosphatidylinositol-4-phosphate 5-kinase
VLSELCSPGKSGSFFYFSRDYRFIIKVLSFFFLQNQTIKHSEHKFLLEILEKYTVHIKNNPNTLLSRIYGLHRVKLPGNRKIHFVVMGNVNPPNKDVHRTYDLKGSSVGRIIKDGEATMIGPIFVLKDMNWIKSGEKLQFGPEKSRELIEQLEKDVGYLKGEKIMDYSLLVGVHDMIKGNKENIRDATLAEFAVL